MQMPDSGKTIKKLLLSKQVLVMGVLNVTPDSFSDGGKYLNHDAAVERGRQMIAEGADIIDIGGESTRPFADKITPEEEISRIIPVIKTLSSTTDAVISTDTTNAETAEAALKNGASVINDISSFTFDKKIAKIIADYKSEVILMHIKGNPSNMQKNPSYENVCQEVTEFLQQRIAFAVENSILPEKIYIDPGIGFGKRLEDNLALLNNLDKICQDVQYPMLIGTSRKSFIGSITGEENPEKRIWGTAASVAVAVMKGARIVRVHDVKQMKEVIDVTVAIAKQTI